MTPLASSGEVMNLRWVSLIDARILPYEHASIIGQTMLRLLKPYEKDRLDVKLSVGEIDPPPLGGHGHVCRSIPRWW